MVLYYLEQIIQTKNDIKSSFFFLGSTLEESQEGEGGEGGEGGEDEQLLHLRN